MMKLFLLSLIFAVSHGFSATLKSYDNANCDGSPTSTTTADYPTGCQNGTIAVCDGGIKTTSYANYDCTGASSVVTLENGVCYFGLEFTCSASQIAIFFAFISGVLVLMYMN
mmetsp:Transcript_10635/g.9613  ORF Transcript_10635/g.9613 Transcript_10635/m.9613 type:complete len:112 (-) Transcript_10635:116-451(-)